jgi:hypothetical protein
MVTLEPVDHTQVPKNVLFQAGAFPSAIRSHTESIAGYSLWQDYPVETG